MSSRLEQLVAAITKLDGINDKSRLEQFIRQQFRLTKDRSVYYCDAFAIRFSKSAGSNFGNTVLSLSALQKYDDLPFVVCVVTPEANICFLANTTFLKKISHSSHELRVDNIRGSFNGSDIVRDFQGIYNVPENMTRLFAIHSEIGFDGNLPRLVEATNDIVPTGSKYLIGADNIQNVRQSPYRAIKFVSSRNYNSLREDLWNKVQAYTDEILIASLIDNVNVRGRVIEYLISGQSNSLKDELVKSLHSYNQPIPQIKTDNLLGDYARGFDSFNTEIDVKTKILILNSNPKAYNIDKMLEFMATDKSVFLFFFVGIHPGKPIKTALIPVFQKHLLTSTIVLRHWAGRNSRGVTQFEGSTIDELIHNPNTEIDISQASQFLDDLIEL